MGDKAHRMDDKNTGDGAIDSIPQSTVKANGKVLAVNGSSGTACGIGVHAAGVWKTANGSLTVKAGGIPVNSETDDDTCAHTRTGGSGDVNIG